MWTGNWAQMILLSFFSMIIFNFSYFFLVLPRNFKKWNVDNDKIHTYNTIDILSLNCPDPNRAIMNIGSKVSLIGYFPIVLRARQRNPRFIS